MVYRRNSSINTQMLCFCNHWNIDQSSLKMWTCIRSVKALSESVCHGLCLWLSWHSAGVSDVRKGHWFNEKWCTMVSKSVTNFCSMKYIKMLWNSKWTKFRLFLFHLAPSGNISYLILGDGYLKYWIILESEVLWLISVSYDWVVYNRNRWTGKWEAMWLSVWF